MDAGLIFLICFCVVFGVLLTGGWQFGHPLLVRYARRKSSPGRTLQNQHTGNETNQGRQELAGVSRKAEGLAWASRKHLVRGRSAPSTSDGQPNPSPQVSLVCRLSIATSQTRSSDGSGKYTSLDLGKESHDLKNMIPVPPVPTKCVSRRSADIGTQVSLLLLSISHAIVPAALDRTF